MREPSAASLLYCYQGQFTCLRQGTHGFEGTRKSVLVIRGRTGSIWYTALTGLNSEKSWDSQGFTKTICGAYVPPA